MHAWALALLATASLLASGAAAQQEPEGPLVPRGQICVVGDAGFLLPTSGVVGGSGTGEDPYIIAGWSVKPELNLVGAQPAPLCPWDNPVLIRDTSAHFVLRDILVGGDPLPAPARDLTYDQASILLLSNHAAGIERVEVDGMPGAAIMRDIDVLSVADLRMTDTGGDGGPGDGHTLQFQDIRAASIDNVTVERGVGVSFENVNGSIITALRVVDGREDGWASVSGQQLTQVTFEELEVSGAPWAGARFTGTRDLAIRYANMHGNPAGQGGALTITSADRPEVSNSTIVDTGQGNQFGRGLVVAGSREARVFNNTIRGNSDGGLEFVSSFGVWSGGNLVADNGLNGLVFYQVTGATSTDDIVTGTYQSPAINWAPDGVVVRLSEDVRFTRLQSADNGASGVFVQQADSVLLVDSHLLRNGEYGLEAPGLAGSLRMQGGAIRGNGEGAVWSSRAGGDLSTGSVELIGVDVEGKIFGVKAAVEIQEADEAAPGPSPALVLCLLAAAWSGVRRHR